MYTAGITLQINLPLGCHTYYLKNSCFSNFRKLEALSFFFFSLINVQGKTIPTVPFITPKPQHLIMLCLSCSCRAYHVNINIYIIKFNVMTNWWVCFSFRFFHEIFSTFPVEPETVPWCKPQLNPLVPPPRTAFHGDFACSFEQHWRVCQW